MNSGRRCDWYDPVKGMMIIVSAIPNLTHIALMPNYSFSATESHLKKSFESINL